MAKANNAPAQAGSKYNPRRWAVPTKRAKNYAEERKMKLHARGPLGLPELTTFKYIVYGNGQVR